MWNRWRTAPAALPALLGLVLALALRPSPSAAAGELETRTLTSYTVTADGGVRVSLAARVTNRDPTTERRSTGRVFYYSTAAFAIHDGASNVAARAGAARLAHESAAETRDSGDPFRLIVVRFDRDLYFNEALDITLDYDLTAVRAAQLLVNGQYAFVPAIGQGTASLVQITAPAGRQLTVGSANCARTAESPVIYLCGSSTTASDYRPGGRCAFAAGAPRWDCAFTGGDFVVIPFEAAAADMALATRVSRVQLARATVEVRVRHFSGDEAWAARVEEIVRRGLPVLEEANGYPYPGLPAIDIVESGYRDTHGYEGLASTQGRVRLTPVVDDQTVLHEVAHLWSGVFASRWLAEGMADYTANVAARRLGLRPETVKRPLPATPVLEEWGPLRSQIALTQAEREQEEDGYNRSLAFVEVLVEQVGSRTLAHANATLAQERIRGTARTYLDLLEQLSGKALASFFAEWALTPADVSRLPVRATARWHAAELRVRAGAVGLPAPRDVERALLEWDFPRAEQLIVAANEALTQHEQSRARAAAAGYALGPTFDTTFADSAENAAMVARSEAEALGAVQAAERRLADGRTPLMRVGLIGARLNGAATGARDALADGDYEQAAASAATLEHRLDTASRDGAFRIAIGAGLLLLLGATLVFRGRGRARAGSRRDVNVLDSAG